MAYLVRGGSPNPYSYNNEAQGYHTIAKTRVSVSGTFNFVPPEYRDSKLGEGDVRVVVAYVRKGTDETFSEGMKSGFSTNSVRATAPIDRDGAKQELQTKANEKKNSFNSIAHLTDDEKRTANQQVEAALDKAKKAIDAASTQTEIDNAKQTFDTELSRVSPKATAHTNATAEVERKANEKKNSFNSIAHLTDDEKRTANQQVEAALDKAKKAIDAASTQTEIDNAKQTFDTELSRVSPKATAHTNATAEVERKANLTLAVIDDNANLSLFEKDVAKNQVRQALQDALKKIDQAKTQDEIDRAKQEALSSMDQILAEAIAKANVRRLSSQDKDGSQTLASPSDTDQSGTSPVNPPAATRNRRTPPRRARRSVGFAGNSQTGTIPSAVDKSELRTLVEELERRLQDLAGLSPEVLEEAHRILGEAQAALANENLTAQELADLLAKVRQVLNSLQTGTSADKSQSASNLNKEAESTKGAKNETEVPLYGVLGAAVLSILGALLFAVARKKSSQLDKLSRELHQLVVELEASDKDKKVLNKAKKLADEARLFVDSHQKDSQKEAELISEIKTVLSQLKEEV
ncbi:surface anchored protein [Streptococcus pneumoniae]|nr:surface anchored protein [Streptococcus pneumoniae]